MNIREAKSIDEIRSLLLTALTDDSSFTVWQRGANSEILFQAKARIEELSEQGMMVFSLSEITGEMNNSELYFAKEDSTIIFKTIKIRTKDNLIAVALPTEAKYKERRRHERTRFKIHERKDIEIVFPKQLKDADEKLLINSQLLDISESGACFLVSKETLQKIDLEIIFKIKSLTGLKLCGEKAKIMNTRRYKGPTLSQGEFYALGVMFI